MLAVVNEIEQFHHYTHDRKVNVVTDPLVVLCAKPFLRASKHLQSLLSAQYYITIHYKPGRGIPIAECSIMISHKKTRNKGALLAVNITLQIRENHQLM